MAAGDVASCLGVTLDHPGAWGRPGLLTGGLRRLVGKWGDGFRGPFAVSLALPQEGGAEWRDGP